MPGFISVGSAVPVPRQAPAITPYGSPPELPQDATPEQLEKAVRTLLRDVYSARPENRTPESLHRSQLADGINATAESAFSHQMGSSTSTATLTVTTTTATTVTGLEWTVTVPVESQVLIVAALQAEVDTTGGTGTLECSIHDSAEIQHVDFFHPTAATADRFVIPLVATKVVARRSSTTFSIKARTTHVSSTYKIIRFISTVAWYAQPVHRGQR